MHGTPLGLRGWTQTLTTDVATSRLHCWLISSYIWPIGGATDQRGKRQSSWGSSSHFLLPSSSSITLAQGEAYPSERLGPTNSPSSILECTLPGLLPLLLQCSGNASPCLGASLSFFGFLHSAQIGSLNVAPLLASPFEPPWLNYNSYPYLHWHKDIKFYWWRQNLSKCLPWVILRKRDIYGQISLGKLYIWFPSLRVTIYINILKVQRSLKWRNVFNFI